jgi:O-antigen ligase
MLGLKWFGEYIAPLGTSGLASIRIAEEEIIRAYGTMPHPNVLAGFLVLGLIIGLYLISKNNSFKQHLVIEIGLLIILFGIFTTFSRLAWLIAAVACLSFMAFNYLQNNRKKAGTILFVFLIVCGTIFSFYEPYLKARVQEGSEKSISDRKLFNDLGLNLIKENPIMGVGIGDYVSTLQEKFTLEPWQHQPPHNIFIFIAAELGLIGLGLFVMILYEIVRSLKKNFLNPLNFTLSILLFSFLLLGMFDHFLVTIQQGRLMFALVLGLIAALPNNDS